MKFEVQDMTVESKVPDEIADECMNITDKKTIQYQKLADRLKTCLENLGETKDKETGTKEEEMQQERFKRRMEEEEDTRSNK